MIPERSTRTSLAVSIALHLVFGAVLVRLVAYTVPLDDSPRRTAEPPTERIAFVATPTLAAETNAGRSGGDGRPLTSAPARQLRAPVTVPSALPPVSPGAPAPTGSGEVIGAGGAVAGIRPTYSDPRLWTPVGPFDSPVLTPAERMDSSLTERLRAFRDSMAAVAYAPNKMERGDWTVERNGEKYGIDRQFIRLGKFSLPTAALALLPFNRQANPITGERERTYNAMHAEIQEQAQRAMNIEEFRNAARAIRERKDRERRERDQAAAAGQATAAPQPATQP